LLHGAALRRALGALASRPLRDVFHRAVPLRYARDPLGRRRPIAAQRFNAHGGARVLYLAEDHATCLHEVQAFGFPPATYAIVPVQVHLRAVLDLRDRPVRLALGLSVAEMNANFRTARAGALAPTQVLGEACAASGLVDGLLYPSLARRGGTNLAVVEAGLRHGGRLLVNDPENNLRAHLP